MSSVLDRCLSPVTLLSIVYFVLLCSIASSSSISWLMTAQSSFLFFCLRNSSKFHVQLSHLMFNRPFCGKWTLVATKDFYKANLGRVRDSAISTKKWEGRGRGAGGFEKWALHSEILCCAPSPSLATVASNALVPLFICQKLRPESLPVILDYII